MSENKKTYSSKELNTLINYVDTGANSDKTAVINRCKRAGIEVEVLPTKRGQPNQYVIISNNLNLPNEVWVPCYYCADWEVSTEGRIRKIVGKRLMGHQDDKNQYIRVCTIDPNTGKSTNQQLNRLIYFSFHPELLPNKDYIQIDHINGQRTDNRLINLQPLTAIENTKKRDDEQARIKTLTTELILKYGYKKVEEILQNLLTND